MSSKLQLNRKPKLRKEEAREGIEAVAKTVAAKDLNALRSGWLEKRSEQGLVSNWKRRHCVLADGLLYYFESPDSAKPQGS